MRTEEAGRMILWVDRNLISTEGNLSEDFFPQIFTSKHFFSCKCFGIRYSGHTVEKKTT